MTLGIEFPDKFSVSVKYSQNRLTVEYENRNSSQRIARNYVDKIIKTKFKHWEYEEEVRLHYGLDEGAEEGGLYFMPFSSELELKEVVLGHSCPVPIAQVRELVNTLHPKAKVIKACLAHDSFRVVPSENDL